MNVNQNINKLLYALSIKNKFYKVGSSQCYSDFKKKYITLYYIYKQEHGKYEYQETMYSKIDIMKYLVKELKGSEADETN